MKTPIVMSWSGGKDSALEKPIEYADQSRGFELGETVHYCAEHEKEAKEYTLAQQIDNLRSFKTEYILQVLGRDRLILLANSSPV